MGHTGFHLPISETLKLRTRRHVTEQQSVDALARLRARDERRTRRTSAPLPARSELDSRASRCDGSPHLRSSVAVPSTRRPTAYGDRTDTIAILSSRFYPRSSLRRSQTSRAFGRGVALVTTHQRETTMTRLDRGQNRKSQGHRYYGEEQPWSISGVRADLGHGHGAQTAGPVRRGNILRYRPILDRVPALQSGRRSPRRLPAPSSATVPWVFCHSHVAIEYALARFPDWFIDGRASASIPRRYTL